MNNVRERFQRSLDTYGIQVALAHVGEPVSNLYIGEVCELLQSLLFRCRRIRIVSVF